MIKAATARRHAHTTEVLAADIGQRIRAARTERGMSLAQLGGDDLSRSFLSLVELGRSRISLRALSIVADRMGLPLSYFLDGTTVPVESLAELLLNQAEIALHQHRPEEALRMLNESEPPDSVRGQALWLRGQALCELGRPREAVPVLQRALTLAEDAGEPRRIVDIEYQLARALYESVNYEESLVHLRGALTRAVRELDDAALMGKLTVAIGHIEFMHGNYGEALAQYARARDLFGSVDDLENLAAVYTGLSRVHQQQGNVPEALRYSRMSVGIYEARNNQRNAAHELNNMAARLEEMGELDRALEFAREAVARAHTHQAGDVEALARSTLAAVYVRLDRLDEAREEAERALDLAPTNGANLGQIDAWIVLAKIAGRNQELDRLDEYYRLALDALRDGEYHTRYADAALAYSLSLQERGDTEGALKYALEAAQAKSTRPA